MDSNKKAKSSSKLSLRSLSFIFILFLCFTLIITSCAREEPQDKIVVGEQDTLVNQEPSNQGQQETETVTETEEEVEEPEEGQEEETEPVETEQEKATEEEKATEPLTIKVYYADSTVQYLVGEERIISATHKYLSAFMELLKPPLEPGHIMLVPENTKVNRISFNEGNINLDLSQEFMEERFKSDAVDVLLVYSIVNTLTEFAEVNTVTLYINGQKLNTLGQLDISNSLYRDRSWIKEN